MDYTDAEICVLAEDDTLTGVLEDILDGFDLGVDYLTAQWGEMVEHLDASSVEEVVVLMSLARLCVGGLDAILAADFYCQQHPNFKPILLVEPEVASELDSVRLMTRFEHMVDTIAIESDFSDVLMKALPGLKPRTPELDPAPRPLDIHRSPEPEGRPLARSIERPERPAHSVLVDLHDLAGGDLAETWVSRLFYSLYVRAFTGKMVLSTGQKQTEIHFKDGVPGTVPGQSRDKLVSAFGWEAGEFSIEPTGVPASFVPVSSVMSLIYDGMLRYTSLNRAARRMTGLENKFPIQTEFFSDRLVDFDDLRTLQRFCQLCTGQKTWSQVISTTWDDIQEVLKVACFCMDTDLVVFRADKLDRPARVEYTTRSTFNVRRSLTNMIARTTKTEGNAREAEIAALKTRLEERLEYYSSIDAFELFGLRPMCGAESVRNRYYKLVKDHHPDVVGGNISPEIKSLAELIFIHVKDAYVELLSLEKKRGGPMSRGPSERHTSSVRKSSPSSAKRAAAAQVDAFSKGRSSGSVVTSAPTARDSVTPQKPRDSVDAVPNKIRKARKKITSEVDTSKIRPRRKQTGEMDASKIRPRRKQTTGVSTPRAGSGDKVPHIPRARPAPRAMPRKRPGTAPREEKPAGAEPVRASRPNIARRMTRELTPEAHFKNGMKFMRVAQYAKAKEAFKLACEEEEENPQYRANYAWAMYMEDPDEKKKVKVLLKESLKLQGKRSDANLFLARMAKREGNMDTAKTFFEAALKADRRCVEAQRELRLYNMRKENEPSSSKSGDKVESLFGKLFQRKK